MRHNFVNDIGDYAKYALLRAVCAQSTVRLGVLWYLTDHADVNGHGRRRPHLSLEGWDDLDPALLMKMKAIEKRAGRADKLHLSLIERSHVLPASTRFFREPLPRALGSPQARSESRAAWFARARAAVAGCNVVFLDPDNGLEVQSVGRSSRLAGKYATVDETAALLASGAGVILYQHGDRSVWRDQRSRVEAQLRAGIAGSLKIRSFRFGAYGARAFFCVSRRSAIAAVFDSALETLSARVAASPKAHYILIE